MPVFHGTFTLQRTWAAAPEHMFSAWSDQNLRAKWFTGPPGKWTTVQHTLDLRTGGQEILEGRFSDSGMQTYYDARFHLVEPARRLLYAYDLHQAGSFHSITLATLVLEAAGGKTHVTYTEQIAFLDGNDGTADRQRGTEQQLQTLESTMHLQQA
jgi:uncharacterized protein YndB with AHSA1/START domain